MNRCTICALALTLSLHCACKHESIQADPARAVDAGVPTGGMLDGAASEGGDASELVPADAAATCPSNLPGPQMALVASPKGTRYCIDTTEVTQVQYDTFVHEAGTDLSLVAAIPECASHKSYEIVDRPDDDPIAPGCPKGVYAPATKGDLPVGCTTWCMAYAYCRWAGKRLCGRIGGGPLADPVADFKNAEASQWYNACSQGGKYTYPYGNTYKPQCASATLDPVTDVNPECAGKGEGFESVSGMTFGVMEWEDDCHAEQGLDCRLRGADYLDTEFGESQSRCDVGGVTSRGVTDPQVGFRCCLDVD